MLLRQDDSDFQAVCLPVLTTWAPADVSGKQWKETLSEITPLSLRRKLSGPFSSSHSQLVEIPQSPIHIPSSPLESLPWQCGRLVLPGAPSAGLPKCLGLLASIQDFLVEASVDVIVHLFFTFSHLFRKSQMILKPTHSEITDRQICPRQRAGQRKGENSHSSLVLPSHLGLPCFPWGSPHR